MTSVLLCGCLAGLGRAPAQAQAPEAPLPSEVVPEWGVVGQSAGLRTVFIGPEGLTDRFFIIQVLRRVVEEAVPRQPVDVASVALGDRVDVEEMSITAGRINVRMVTHAKDDPMCCPTERVTVIYRLAGSALSIELSAD